MTDFHFTLATAGHVDHGKSSLVKALTGTDPDRLPEEKARGITIDLGFAALTLPGPGSSVFQIGIVDVPGHEDLVKNMVAGVGAIDLALFVVAADDGWMPQTEEHLQILSYLGVRRGVVAFSKIDLAQDEARLIETIREQLRDTPFAEAPIVPTSVMSGRGIEPLKAALAEALKAAPPPRDIGKPRLPIDRAFTLPGIGTVVTGTLSGGRFQRGQSVVLQPSQAATRLRTIQSHHREVDQVGPGTRTALSLADVSLAQKGVPDGVRRGQVVTLAEFGAPAATCDVLLHRSPRLVPGRPETGRPLKDGSRVRIHQGSANFAARVLLLEQGELAPGEDGLAQLRLEAPAFLFLGDRFIVRDWSEQSTLAGGVILNAEAGRQGFRDPAYHQHLQQLKRALPDPAGLVEAWLAWHKIARRTRLLIKSHFSPAEVAAACEQLSAAGRLVLRGELVAAADWWAGAIRCAAAAIDAHHSLRPEELGLPLSQLRVAVKEFTPWAEVFESLLAELAQRGFVQSGVSIKRATHQPALPPALQAAGQQLRNVLSAKPLDPPSRKELAGSGTAQQALRFLLQTGEAVEIGSELVLLADNYRRAVRRITEHLAQGRGATVSELRQVLGTSRRVLVPLLEKMDRDGVTRRQGDLRVLR